MIKTPDEYISLPLERQELKDHLILLVEKEKFLVENLCGKRTKKKGMYWSEEGLQRILNMVLKRYVVFYPI